MTKTTKTDLFDLIRCARDQFHSDFANFRAVRDDMIKSAKKDFIGQRYKNEVESAHAQFNKAIDDLRKSLSRQVLPEIEAEKQSIINEVQRVPLASTMQLNFLSGRTVDETEFRILVERFGGQNYWVDRQLEDIGTENGIVSDDDLNLRSRASSRLASLNELERQFNDMLMHYGENNEVTLHDVHMCHDSEILKLEKAYTQNFKFSEFSEKQLADRAFRSLRAGQASPFESGMMLREAVSRLEKNGHCEAAQRLLYAVSQSPMVDNGTLGAVGAEIAVRVHSYASGRKKPVVTKDDSLREQIDALTDEEKSDAEYASLYFGDKGEITQREIDYIHSDDYKEAKEKQKESAGQQDVE